MSNAPLSRDVAEAAVAAVQAQIDAGFPLVGSRSERGAIRRAAETMGGMAPQTLRSQLEAAWRLYRICPRERISVKMAGAVSPLIPMDEPDEGADDAGIHDAQEDQIPPAEKRRIKQLQAELDAMSNIRGALFRLTAESPNDFVFAREPRSSGEVAESTPVVLASDWQIGEVVNADDMAGINAFDMHIAEERAAKLFNKVVELSELVLVPQPRVVLACMGDMISGEIHEDLAETNDLSSAPAVRHTFKLLRAGINRLLDRFPHVHVVWVDGNHDRTTRKIRSKAYSNLSYGAIIGWWLQSAFEDDPRVTFQQPRSGDAIVNLYGHRIAFLHGDRMGSSGGQGFIGPIATIIRGHQKVISQYARLQAPIRYVCTGHLHTSARLPTGIANGSLVGSSEYARAILRAMPEAAQQAMVWVNRRHGIWNYQSIHLSEEPRVGLLAEDNTDPIAPLAA